ncbi:GNAT family N-acetyltransferase [Paenibacillus alvei]
MTIIIRKSTLEDIEDLLLIQKASFQDDLKIYQDFETNPACETSEKLEENIQKYHHFTILEENTIIGAIDVRGNKERMHIDKVFITPSKQNKGTGTMAIQFLEK